MHETVQPLSDQLVDKLSQLSKASASSVPDEAHSKLLKSLSSIAGKTRERARRRILRDERLISSSKPSDKAIANLASTTLSGFGSISIDDLIRAGTTGAASTSKAGQTTAQKAPKQLQQLKRQIHQYKKQEEASAPLPTALEQKEQQAIRRQVAYENARKEGTYWVPFIKRARAAAHVQFPLAQPKLDIISTAKAATSAAAKLPSKKPWNELEQEVMSALSASSDNMLTSTSNLTRNERRTLRALSLNDAHAQRRELRRHRALLSAQEDKARRVKKIKSKRYHRSLKKDRVRTMLAEFERMREENPEAALDKLRQLEEARLQERMSLKHRNTSKWTKQQLVRSKFDRDARSALRDQLELSRQLTQKPASVDDGDENGEASTDAPVTDYENSAGLVDNNFQGWLEKTFDAEASSNPWMAAGSKGNSAGKKLHAASNETNNEVELKVDTAADDTTDDDDDDDEDDEDEELDPQSAIDRTFSQLKQNLLAVENGFSKPATPSMRKSGRKAKKSDLKLSAGESVDADEDMPENYNIPNGVENNVGELMAPDLYVPAEPDNAFRGRSMKRSSEQTMPAGSDRKPKLLVSDFTTSNSIADIQSDDDSVSVASLYDDNGTKKSGRKTGEQDEKIKLIAEAFAEDDVYEEFRTDKLRAEEDKKERLQRQLFGDEAQHDLPGWGEWSGPGAPPESQRKKRQRRMRRMQMTDGIMQVLAEERKQISRLHKGQVDAENVIFDMDAIGDKSAVRALQVSELPYPFASVAQYEAVMADSVGRDWNPETVVAQLTRPRVEIQRGAIIEPVSHRVAAQIGGGGQRRADVGEDETTDDDGGDNELTAVGGDGEKSRKLYDIEIKNSGSADYNGAAGGGRRKKKLVRSTKQNDESKKRASDGNSRVQKKSGGGVGKKSSATVAGRGKAPRGASKPAKSTRITRTKKK